MVKIDQEKLKRELMGITDTDLVIADMKKEREERVPIADDMFIPNHSGEHDAGTTGTPVSDLDIANKKYVDDNIPANIFLFFTKNGSDLGGVYLDQEVDPVTDTEESTLTAIPANSTGTLMVSYATQLADSVIGGIV